MGQFILCPSGSHGDVHPFVAVGQALQARGHRVVMNTSAHFEPLARKAGFAFDAIGTEEDFQKIINDPGLWHPTKSLQVLFGGEIFRRGLKQSFENIRKRNDQPTVLVAGSLSMAARIANEALKIPLATVHLQPMACPSVSEPPVFPRMSPRRWWPRWLVRAYYYVGERHVVDPILGPAVNGLRQELGLPPVKRLWGPWRHSPQCILGFFPEWFGRPPDWPAHLYTTGFVRYDQSDGRLDDRLDAFLHAGEPPVVISFGSAMRTGKAHFTAALEACVQLEKRAVLLARGTEQIPPLPSTAFHAEYAPFSLVFPKACAVIHHGGIGTCAQALAAGVPQLIMPLAFDQFDNAKRLESRNLARSLPASKFDAKSAARKLQETLSQVKVDEQLKREPDPLPGIMSKLEALLPR